MIPAGVAENARLLADKVDEVGLCLFETRACLDYGPHDLPPDLAALPLPQPSLGASLRLAALDRLAPALDRPMLRKLVFLLGRLP